MAPHPTHHTTRAEPLAANATDTRSSAPYVGLAFAVGLFVACLIATVAFFGVRRYLNGRCEIGFQKAEVTEKNTAGDIKNYEKQHSPDNNTNRPPDIVLADCLPGESSVTPPPISELFFSPQPNNGLGELDISDARELGPVDTVDFAISQLAADMSIQLPVPLSPVI